LAALALDTDKRNVFQIGVRGSGIGDRASESRSPKPETRSPSSPGFAERIKSRFRGWMIGGLGRMRPLPATSAVHIARAESYDDPLAEILARQFDHFRPTVPLAGKRVVLKPNLVEFRREKVINTDPRVIDAVIQLCKKEGAAEITVAEGPGHWRNVQYLVKECGLGAVLEKHGVRFVDLNHDEPVKMTN